MAKKLFANGQTGLVAISEPIADINAPLSNLQNIYFHSALDYLFVRQIISGSITLPFRQFSGADVSSAYGAAIYNLGSHGLGYTPLVFGYLSDRRSLVGETFVQANGTVNIRTVQIGADSQFVYLREIFLNKTVSFNAITLNFTVELFNETGV
jgi:hypothetical protein